MRPCKKRRVRFKPNATYFKPRGIPLSELELVRITSEEMEAIRLKNILQLDQTQAALKMRTSQSTYQRILATAYKKIADALVSGKAIEIISLEAEKKYSKDE